MSARPNCPVVTSSRLRRSPRALTVLALACALLVPACTQAESPDETRHATEDPWAGRTVERFTRALEREPGIPYPAVVLAIRVQTSLYNVLTAQLGVQRLEPRRRLPTAVGRTVASLIDPDTGLAEASGMPTEVLTWLSLLLGRVPGADALRRDLDGAADRQVAAIRSRLAGADRDLYTDLYWVRVLELLERDHGRGSSAAAGLLRSLPTDLWCRAALAQRNQDLDTYFVALGSGEEIARASGRSCRTVFAAEGVSPNSSEVRTKLSTWQQSILAEGALQSTDVDSLNALLTLRDAGLVRGLQIHGVARAVREAVAADRIERTPIAYLSAATAADRLGTVLAVGPAGAAMLESLAGGTELATPAPNPITLIQAHDVLTMLGGRQAVAPIERLIDWGSSDLLPVDRAALAVAASAPGRVDLAAFRRAAVAPQVMALALRVEGLVGRCRADLRAYVRRAGAVLRTTPATTAENPFTASGYAALIDLGRRCRVRSAPITALHARLTRLVRDLLGTDGLARSGSGVVNVNLSATLALAACRLDDADRRPSRAAVSRAERGLLAPGGGASSVTGEAPTLDATLAVAQLRTIARHGCRSVPSRRP